MAIDATDERILSILLDNARLSYRQIARQLKLSAVTVMNRIKALEKQGIITGYTTKLDYEKLGYDVQVVIDVRIAKGKLFEVEEKIATHPNVFAVYDVTGGFDTIIVAKFKNRRSMDDFLKKIQKYPFVERTETKLILNVIREEPVKP